MICQRRVKKILYNWGNTGHTEKNKIPRRILRVRKILIGRNERNTKGMPNKILEIKKLRKNYGYN